MTRPSSTVSVSEEHDVTDDEKAYAIVGDALEFPGGCESLIDSIAHDVDEEGRRGDSDDGSPIALQWRTIGAIVALCNVTAVGHPIAARQVVALERIADALERAFPKPASAPGKASE